MELAVDRLSHLLNELNSFWALGTVGLVVFLFAFFFLKKPKKKTPEKAQPLVSQSAPESLPKKATVSSGLGKTALFLQGALDRVLANSEGEKFYSDLEEALLSADVGLDFSEKVIQGLKSKNGIRTYSRPELRTGLKDILGAAVPEFSKSLQSLVREVPEKPYVIMVVGINGAGKTTTIGKLCHFFRSHGKTVLVGAADTFRAAATEQLKAWVEKSGAEGVFQKEGADPSSVAFDSVKAAINRQVDVCIIDTAGRLHTKQGLMDELAKMKRVVAKAAGDSNKTLPHEVWLVLDGTIGQNALIQAREFHKSLGLTGVIVTKLDGSSKGGVVLSVMSELNVPVVMVGVGEGLDDLIPFEKDQFVEGMLGGL